MKYVVLGGPGATSAAGILIVSNKRGESTARVEKRAWGGWSRSARVPRGQSYNWGPFTPILLKGRHFFLSVRE